MSKTRKEEEISEFVSFAGLVVLGILISAVVGAFYWVPPVWHWIATIDLHPEPPRVVEHQRIRVYSDFTQVIKGCKTDECWKPTGFCFLEVDDVKFRLPCPTSK